MFIGVCTIEIHVPDSGSLKAKRHSLRSLKDRIRNKFNVSVAEVDVGSFKGSDAVASMEASTQEALRNYVELARKLGFAADLKHDLGTDIVKTASALVESIVQKFPKSTVFAGQSVFRQPSLIHRIMHNETAFAIQQELRWKGIMTIILPIRINI